MKIKQSFIINGPQISDSLSGELSGLDLSGTGIDGGSPGDTSFFNIFVSIQSTEAERQIYDYVQSLKVYVDSNSQYAGDTSASADLTDILELGDMGYGLAIKNPTTGLYDIRFNSSNYNSFNNAFLLQKELMIKYDYSDVNNPTIIGFEGFNSATVDSSSTGYSLVSTTSVFTPNMVGYRVFNKTDGTSAIIEQYVSATNVILKTSIGNTWDGDNIYIKSLREPHDGALAVSDDVSEWLGDYCKLQMQFSLPTDYKRNGIKQFALKFTSGNE